MTLINNNQRQPALQRANDSSWRAHGTPSGPSGASVNPLITTDRLVFGRFRMGGNFVNQASSNQNLTLVVSPTKARAPENFRVVYMNRALNNVYTDPNAYGEQVGPNLITIRASAAYVPASANSGNGWAGVVTVPHTFNNAIIAKSDGAHGVTISTMSAMIADGGTLSGDGKTIGIAPGYIVVSDPRVWTEFGLTTATAGSRNMWHKTETVVPTNGGSWPQYTGDAGITNEATVCFAASGGLDQVYSSVPLDTTGSTSTSKQGHVPCAVIGKWGAVTPLPALIAQGMSITVGQGSGTDTQTSTSGGYMSEAFKQSTWPHCIAALGSMESLYFLGDTAGFRWLARYADEAFLDEGTNSIAGGRSASDTIADFTSFTAILKTLGVAKVHWCTITPRATSTDNFTNLTNQTGRDPHFGNGEDRDLFNTAIQSSPVPTSWIDTTSYLQDPTDHTAWLTNGSAGTYIQTGAPYNHVHPTQAGHTLMKGLIGDANSLLKRCTDATAH